MCKAEYGGHKVLESFLATGGLAFEKNTRMITRPAQKRPERDFWEHLSRDRPPVKRLTPQQKKRQRDKRAERQNARMRAGFYVKMNAFEYARARRMWTQHEQDAEASEYCRQMSNGMYVEFPTPWAKRRALALRRDQ